MLAALRHASGTIRGAVRQVGPTARLPASGRLLLPSRPLALGSLAPRSGAVAFQRLEPLCGTRHRFFSDAPAAAEGAGATSVEQALPKPFKPLPGSKRFAFRTKSFFPILNGNLRPNFKNKKRSKIGKGLGQKGPERHMHFREKGKNSKTWERGANPLFRKIPKWKAAHKHMTRKKLEPLNLAKLRTFIERGRLDTRFPITQRHLYDSQCVKKVRLGVTLFNVNDYPFPYKIDIEVAGADQSSIDMIKAVGGTVTIVYMEPITLRAHVKPWKYEVLPRTARPTLKMVHKMEKLKAMGAQVRYIKPLWLIEEERRLQTQLRELREEDGHLLAEQMARRDEKSIEQTAVGRRIAS